MALRVAQAKSELLSFLLLNSHPSLAHANAAPTQPASCAPPRLLQTFDKTLFLASHSSLRSFDLVAWKAACDRWLKRLLANSRLAEDFDVVLEVDELFISDISFKEYVGVAAGFPLAQIALNKTGKLLAAAGDHSVAVLVLPTLLSKTSVPGKNVVECKYMNISYRVGDIYYSTDLVNRIVKVEWHPLSENGAHLLVLSSNGVLRMFNVALNPEEPELEIHMFEETRLAVPRFRNSAPKTKRRTFLSADFGEREAVSFCFGGSSDDKFSTQNEDLLDSGWGLFSSV
ncbi:hypothetical protein HK096_004104 [Nowakowskiella sp. JEL0078]|nr:hypothetical protein HK096_004104 [Nowakowskiella sp. JEL0078]